MMNFKVVAPTPSEQQEDGIVRFVVIEAGILLVGMSLTLVEDYCAKNVLTDEAKKVIASGSCLDGQLVFEDGVPGWKRDEIRDFLAGKALPALFWDMIRGERLMSGHTFNRF
jgi:hypothetical protein